MAIRMHDRENEIRTILNSSLTRRELLKLAGLAAVVVGLGGGVTLLGREDKFLRPPGALTEREFLSLCIKCQRCQQVCPTGVITPVTLTKSTVNAGTPKLDFTLGYCNLCMKCTEVCPTGALQPIEKEAVKLGIAQVDKERCIAWAWKGCNKCYEECPFEAITLDSMQRPTVDADKCNGCGLCEYVCPISALRAYTGVSGKGIIIAPVDIKETRDA